MEQVISNALDNFSKGALCTWLNRPGAAAAVSTLALGAITVPDPFTTAAGLGLLATQAGCAFNSNPSPDAGNWEGSFYNVCNCENRAGYNVVYVYTEQFGETFWTNMGGLKDFEFRNEQYQSNVWVHYLKGKYCGNTTGDWDFEISTSSSSPEVFVKQEADTSLPCVGSSEKPAPSPRPEPITGESPDLNCTLTADLGAWIQSPSGNVLPVIKYKSLPSGLRSDGGIISGCNWYGDLIYIGGDGGNGPPTVGPFPPDVPWPPEGPDVPDWLKTFLSSLAADITQDFLAGLLESPYAGTTYRLVSVCETDSSGEPISQAVEEIIPTLPINDAILTRLDAIVPLLQGQKDFKQPICPPAKASGDLRTISFRSVEVSPNGKSCLRKRLRYRSISGIGLDGLIDHWKDFSFQAGPVLVKHVGSTLGTIKCWADSIDEGKRVLLHAFGEAGVDANQAGRWEVSGSSSTRLGMPGTMNVDTTGGYYWITARDGSNNRPIVGDT